MTDDRMEQIVGNLLRAGVALAAAIVLIGGVWYLAVNGEHPIDYHQFHPKNGARHLLSGLSLPGTIIFAGLLILVATPVARVLFSLIAFALERDRLYIALTAAVLLVLIYSIGSAWW